MDITFLCPASIKVGDIARQLNLRDELVDSMGKDIEIVELKQLDLSKTIKVYNLEVKDNLNYYITEQEVLVHNHKLQ